MRVVFVGKDRTVWREVVLAVITFGIHRRIWLYRVNREVDGHEALGLRHFVTALLLCLPILGPLVVSVLAARRIARMVQGSPVPYSAAAGWANLVPLFGSILFFMPWTQTRLNRFWAHERTHKGAGVEVDVDLGSDPRFLVEMGRALRESYYAGSRFETRKKARRERWAVRRDAWSGLRAERDAVRAAGGSTPLLPWRAPQRPAVRLLHVTCGRCQETFDVRRDPAADTPIVCPKCGAAEVLPSLHSDPLRRTEKVAVPELAVRCPRCKTTFHAVHNLHGPTLLRCPKCGTEDTLAAPAAGPAQGRRKAERPETTRA